MWFGSRSNTLPVSVSVVSMDSTQRKHEIEMFIGVLRERGHTVEDQVSSTCITLDGNHQDFKCLADVHMFLNGAAVMADIYEWRDAKADRAVADRLQERYDEAVINMAQG